MSSMYDRDYDLIVIGESMVEFSCDGCVVESEAYGKDVGGADVVVAATAARLGARVKFISAIAEDPFGAFIRDRLAQQNVDISSVVTCKQCYNGIYYTSERYPQRRDYLVHHPGTANRHIVPALIDESHIENTKIVYASSELQSVSRETRHTVFKAFHIAHSRNIMVAYDPNLRLMRWSLDEARECLWSVLSLVDVIILSSPDESKALLGYERPIDVIGFLWDRGVSTVVVKTGAGGCVVGHKGYDKNQMIQVFQQPDTQGAVFKTPTLVGSAFNGAFLYVIASGHDPFVAAEFANSVALYKGIKGVGIDSLPTAEDLRIH